MNQKIKINELLDYESEQSGPATGNIYIQHPWENSSCLSNLCLFTCIHKFLKNPTNWYRTVWLKGESNSKTEKCTVNRITTWRSSRNQIKCMYFVESKTLLLLSLNVELTLSLHFSNFESPLNGRHPIWAKIGSKYPNVSQYFFARVRGWIKNDSFLSLSSYRALQFWAWKKRLGRVL